MKVSTSTTTTLLDGSKGGSRNGSRDRLSLVLGAVNRATTGKESGGLTHRGGRIQAQLPMGPILACLPAGKVGGFPLDEQPPATLNNATLSTSFNRQNSIMLHLAAYHRLGSIANSLRIIS
jgi:hypothetical protein